MSLVTQTPLKTEATPLEEDAGAYSMVSEEQVKTIRTGTGETKVVPKKVEKPEERKNVAPKSKSDGFTHRISHKTEHFSDKQITLLKPVLRECRKLWWNLKMCQSVQL